MAHPILQIKDLIKVYYLYPTNKDKLKALFKLPHEYKLFYALNGINLSIDEGESVGVIGLNGSGKSTFSNIIAGLSPATSGEITVNGSVSLLSIATGLNNELTGRENIELKCLMLGLNKKQIKSLEPEIIEFSELGEYIDRPVKQYSSGM